MDQNQLKKTLAALKLSQLDLAVLVDVTPRAVALWLNGDRGVPGSVDAYLNLFAKLSPEQRADETRKLLKETTTMKEGMYLLSFAAAHGAGNGTLTFEAGRVYGFDMGNGHYDGSYKHNHKTGMVDVEMSVKMPPGVQSVLGPAQPFEWTVTVRAVFDPNKDEGSIIAQTNLGQAAAHYKFMRTLPLAA